MYRASTNTYGNAAHPHRMNMVVKYLKILFL